MDLFSLVARLTLDRSDYEKGMSDATNEGEGFASKLKGGLATAAKVGTAAVAAVGAAAGTAATAFINGAGELASYGDNIDKMSQKLGMSAEAYQEWDAIMQHSGTSIESMQSSMKTLASAAETGNDAFEALGISQQDLAKMDQEELFSATIAALQNVENETQRTYLAGKLLGRGATELGPLLNTSAEDTEAMRRRVHELGGVMSNEAVKAAAKYQDSLQDMTTAMDGLKRGMMADFLPAVTTVMDGLTELFSGGDGVGQISEGLGQFVDQMAAKIPQVLQTGTRIVTALTGAIVANLPTLIDAATKAILTLGTGLVQQLPTIVEAGLQIILSLAQGIADSLPELIPTIVDVVLKIVDILTEPNTLSNLVDAAIQIILALADGLIQALPRLIEAVPRIIANLVAAIVSNAPKLLEAGLQLIVSMANGIISGVGDIVGAVGQIGTAIWNGITDIVGGAAQWGRDLIDNFIGGIRSMWSNLKNTVSSVAQTVTNFLGFSEPEEGPLSNFHTYAPDMMALFAQGIEDNAGLITDAIGRTFDFGPQIAAQTPAGAREFTVPRDGAGIGARTLTAVFQLNGEEVGRILTQLIETEQQRVGVRLSPA